MRWLSRVSTRSAGLAMHPLALAVIISLASVMAAVWLGSRWGFWLVAAAAAGYAISGSV